MNEMVVYTEKVTILPLVWAILWFVHYLWTVHCDCIDQIHQTLKERQDHQQKRAREKLHHKLKKIYHKLKDIEAVVKSQELA